MQNTFKNQEIIGMQGFRREIIVGYVC